MKKVSQVVQDRIRLQAAILNKFGDDALDQAIQQFCLVCYYRTSYRPGCQKELIPLTLAGERCPYFSLDSI